MGARETPKLSTEIIPAMEGAILELSLLVAMRGQPHW